MQIDQDKLHQFLGQMVGELGAAMNASLVLIGEKLGLYKAMAGAGPMTPADLARKTNTDERYVREWLSAQAAGGYVTYDAATKSFTLPDEQAFALAMEDSPAYMPGAFHIISAVIKDEPKLTEAFRTGDGVGWDEHDASLFIGTEKFFRPNYAANLVSGWIPALDGVEAKLKHGARGGRHRLRAWRFHHFDGAGVSEFALRRVRLSWSLHRFRPARRRQGRCRQYQLRSCSRSGFPRREVRFRDLLRLPARHGRSGGRGEARAGDAESGRLLDDRRAVRARRSGKQFEPGGPPVLCSVHDDLHARLKGAGSRPLFGRAGRRRADEEGGDGRRLQEVPPGPNPL